MILYLLTVSREHIFVWPVKDLPNGSWNLNLITKHKRVRETLLWGQLRLDCPICSVTSTLSQAHNLKSFTIPFHVADHPFGG